jgi:hypothetical protein
MCVVGHEASERESNSFRNVRTSGDCCLVALECGLKTSGVGWIGIRGRWGSLRGAGNESPARRGDDKLTRQAMEKKKGTEKKEKKKKKRKPLIKKIKK